MSAVTEGIKRRQAGELPEGDGIYYLVDDVVTRNGLPSINSHEGGHDPDYIGFLYELMEQLLRRDDAADAGSEAEVTFIERQIDYMIWQARQKWSVSS
jgi:hypothetical protein